MKSVLALLAGLVLCATTTLAGEFPDISITELKAALAAKNVTVIDANGTKSYRAGHVPGALNFTAVKHHLATVLPADKNALIVAYCGGPKCMAYQQAAQAVKQLGYTNVKHLSAGISGWKAAQEETEKAQ